MTRLAVCLTVDYENRYNELNQPFDNPIQIRHMNGKGNL